MSKRAEVAELIQRSEESLAASVLLFENKSYDVVACLPYSTTCFSVDTPWYVAYTQSRLRQKNLTIARSYSTFP